MMYVPTNRHCSFCLISFVACEFTLTACFFISSLCSFLYINIIWVPKCCTAPPLNMMQSIRMWPTYRMCICVSNVTVSALVPIGRSFAFDESHHSERRLCKWKTICKETPATKKCKKKKSSPKIRCMSAMILHFLISPKCCMENSRIS